MNENLPSTFDQASWLTARIRLGQGLQLASNPDIYGVITRLRYSIVESESCDMTINDVEVIVQFSGGVLSDWMALALFRRELSSIPTFASTDEADAWMADQTWVDRGLNELLG